MYPNGRTINYNYGDTGGVLMGNSNAMLDNAIGRLDGIVDGANSGDAGTVLEQYSYLGLSTIVARNHPQTGINLTLIGASGSIGSGGDQYVGLDQFGRIVNQNWVNTTGTTNTTVDGYTYTYDSNGNVLSKTNVLDSAYSETYTYDSLNRLTAVTRGGASYQSWNLDSQGNWSGFTSNGSVQIRTANAQNQITSISGTSATPTYDANGNMIADQRGDTLIYDAWNRLVEVKNSAGAVIAQYTYNAQGYAVTATYPQGTSQIPAGTTNYLYYTSSWQLIEIRSGGTANGDVVQQIVWSAAYINAPILQDVYSAGVIQPNSRLYFTQDANWDTTAVIGYDSATQTWGVVQRFVYSPYGNIIILNANFTTAPAGTVPMVNNLYQGMALDPVTGLYYERARWYSASLGTWISQDPAGYVNGADTYQFVGDGPVGRVDPEGMDSWGLLPPNYQPVPYSAQAPTFGQTVAQTVGGWATDVGNWFRAANHTLTRAGQGLWDLATPGHQGVMDALSPHDQPLNQMLINRLKQAEHSPHGARPGCGHGPQDLAKLLAALNAEMANNAVNFRALQSTVNNAHNKIGNTIVGLGALATGAAGGFLVDGIGLTAAGRATGFPGMFVAGTTKAAFDLGAGLAGGTATAAILGLPQPNIGPAEGISTGSDLIGPFVEGGAGQ